MTIKEAIEILQEIEIEDCQEDNNRLTEDVFIEIINKYPEAKASAIIWAQLCQARKTGNAVWLPYYVGDEVYLSTTRKTMMIEGYSLPRSTDFRNLYFHCRCTEHGKHAHQSHHETNVCPGCAFGDKCFQGFTLSDFGKTVFLTREEAEAALKGAEE